MKNYDCIIVGGGAAGLAAALSAGQFGLSTLVLEKNAIFGKKLKATGNGRGNITNTAIKGHEETIHFFHDIGVMTRVDEAGRVYPYSESAAQLTQALVDATGRCGCEMKTDACVKTIEKISDGFAVRTETDKYLSRTVLVTTGGKAGSVYGCSGDGYNFAKDLGHTVTKILPSLTGVCVKDLPKDLSGVRQKAQVDLYCRDEIIFSETGEVQFTQEGLSGICIFNLSRYLKYLGEEKLAPYRIVLDLYPVGKDDLQKQFYVWQSSLSTTMVEDILCGIFKRPIALEIIRRSALDPEIILDKLSCKEMESLLHHIHHLTFKPIGTIGFKQAQCTAGGICENEVNSATGESLICPGLYFAGEILDYDGPCGGYNLDHAFRSGWAAARAIGEGRS